MTVPGTDGARDREGPDRDEPASDGPYTCSLHVYGIVPADVEVAADARGVGAPGSVTLIRHGDIAALVSRTDATGPPADPAAHERLLNATAAEVPVLPLRFGMVTPDAETIVAELLDPYHDEFARALGELEGRAEYVVEIRYAGDAPLREADVETLVKAVTPVSVLLAPAGPVRERGTARLAILIDAGDEGELRRILDTLTRVWADRVRPRLLGPLAPYDFVPFARSPARP
jgi:Gas vesicle synthesis protein GvpL/GvpF